MDYLRYIQSLNENNATQDIIESRWNRTLKSIKILLYLNDRFLPIG